MTPDRGKGRGRWRRWLSGCRRLARAAPVAVARETAERLAYHRREAMAIALLGGCLLAGLAVERARAAWPAGAARLEAEPAPPRPPPRGAASRERARPPGDTDSARLASAPDCPPPRSGGWPLDLNRATAAELAALPGLSPRLAARIVARREALGGRFASVTDLTAVPGLRARLRGLAMWLTVRPAPGSTPPAPPDRPVPHPMPAASAADRERGP